MTNKTYKEYWHSWVADNRLESKISQSRPFDQHTRFFMCDSGDPHRTNLDMFGMNTADKTMIIGSFGFYIAFSNPELYRDFFSSTIEFIVMDKSVFQIPASDIAVPENWPKDKKEEAYPRSFTALIDITIPIAIPPRGSFVGEIISTDRFVKQMRKIQRGEEKDAFAEIKFSFVYEITDAM